MGGRVAPGECSPESLSEPDKEIYGSSNCGLGVQRYTLCMTPRPGEGIDDEQARETFL